MSNTKNRLSNMLSGDRLVLLGAIAVVFGFFTYKNPNFLGTQNIIGILMAASLVGLVAIGHTFLIIAGMNDLSPGSLAAFAGVLSALLVSKGLSVYLSLPLTIVVTCFAGFFNAWMVNAIKLEPFIATLVTQSIFRGFAYILNNGKAVSVSDHTFIQLGKMRFLKIPFPIWVLIIATVFFGFVLARTKFGRSIYAIGGNRDAARLAGLNPTRIITVSYIMMAILCGVGGILLAARMNSGQPSACENLEFDSITAVILGGVSFSGGVGTMFGTVLGIILIQAFNQGLTMIAVPTFWQYVARGALLLFALTSDYLRKEGRERNLIESSKKNA